MPIFPPKQAAPVAERVMQTLRCGNCQNTVAKVHFFGSGGALSVLECAKCGHGTEYENTPSGISVRDLGKSKNDAHNGRRPAVVAGAAGTAGATVGGKS